MSEVQKAVIKEARQSNDYTLDGLIDLAKGFFDWAVKNPKIIETGLQFANSLING